MNAAPRLYAPGPVYVPERIRLAMAEPVYHHRAPEFRAILADTRDKLRRLWQIGRASCRERVFRVV